MVFVKICLARVGSVVDIVKELGTVAYLIGTWLRTKVPLTLGTNREGIVRFGVQHVNKLRDSYDKKCFGGEYFRTAFQEFNVIKLTEIFSQIGKANCNLKVEVLLK